LGRALALHLDKAFLGPFDSVADHAAIKLNLSFARPPTRTDSAPLTLQVRPSTNEASTQVLQTSQFDLQFAFVAACSLRKNLQNQQRSIIHRQFKMTLEIALLCGTQRLVKKHFYGTVHLGKHTDLIRLARADKKRSIRRLALARDARNGLKTSSLRQQPQLFEV
jgi:hypothetical protein